MAIKFDSDRLIRLLEQSVERWHAAPLVHDAREPFLQRVSILHGYNFQIWHEEDQARITGAGDDEIGRVKRRIDPLNQYRNDAMEALDEHVLSQLQNDGVEAPEAAPLHSEAVGNIVDRLSILSLKAYHMAEETRREDAGGAHCRECETKLRVLQEQRADLAKALEDLGADLSQGRKRFKVYRQMKMYNDPNLNPVLYGAVPEDSV